MAFHISNFSTEISVLLMAVLLGLCHIGVQGLNSDFERGLKWALGPRDEAKPISQIGARLERASKNFQETFPFMLALLLIVEISARSTELTRNLSIIWLLARIIYFPAYAFGWWFRSWAWIISLLAISFLGISLFFK